MPKKGKKGGKTKGKKGGKGKGKKGKKGDLKKKKQENVVQLAAANSRIWETRLELTEKSRNDFRSTAKRLVDENTEMHDLLRQTEKDTIDVITYLKQQDQTKDDEIYKLNESVKDLKRQHRQEKETIIQDLSHQITALEEQLSQKTNDIQLMQNELKSIKEFRRKREQMQKELDDIKEALFATNKDHQSALMKMEKKFFEEKMRMQQEANQKISELADKAHVEAIANMDETTRSVYKENVRLTETLRYHMEAGERLKEKGKRLKEENEVLLAEKELTDTMMKEKVMESKRLKTLVKQLEEKVELLEHSLSQTAIEFERARDETAQRTIAERESIVTEHAKLQRLLELKSREMTRVRYLARNIIDQRAELETFFHEALTQVRSEIVTNQSRYIRDAQAAYQERMREAHAGKGDFPPVRTFHKTDRSSNSVYGDLAAAEKLFEVTGKVDVRELTWEQKERVLRYLFARMNGAVSAAPPPPTTSSQPLPPIKRPPALLPLVQSAPGSRTNQKGDRRGQEMHSPDIEIIEDIPGETFVTQGHLVDAPNFEPVFGVPVPTTAADSVIAT